MSPQTLCASCDHVILARGQIIQAERWFRSPLFSAEKFDVIKLSRLVNQVATASDLFGHERGAFTGALQRKPGKLELAAGGTVFLDEIGELPPALQAKLLRVLQDHTFERVGGTRTLQVDIRVIAATNRDLAQAVAAGTFREDLFFRLHVIPLTLPPLRERREDIPRLAEFFVHKHSLKLKRLGVRLVPEALECLRLYDWPGNVRELENVLERAVVLSSGVLIQPEDLALPAPENSPSLTGTTRYQMRLEAVEQEVLREALQAHGGDKRAAAQALGIALSTLYAKLKKYQF